MECRYLSSSEIASLRNDEAEIFNQLVQKERYLTDSDGYILGDPTLKPLVDFRYKPIPKPIFLPTTNCFSALLSGRNISNIVDNALYDEYLHISNISTHLFLNQFPRYSLEFLGIFLDDIYSGGAWILSSSQYPLYTGILGLHISLMNMIMNRNDILPLLLSEIQKEIDTSTIIIASPLPSQEKIFRDRGFIRNSISYLCSPVRPEQRFLHPVIYSKHFYTLSL